MPAFLLNPMVILGLLLALSVAGNGVLYKLHTGDLQRIGSLKQANKDARADAKACSDAVKKVRLETEKRDRVVAEALKGAEARALAANQQANKTLQEAPIGGDLCAAALELNRRKLKERHP